MTMNDVVRQLYDLSVDHKFKFHDNNLWPQRFKLNELRDAIQKRFQDNRNKIYGEINLPDGSWMFEVSRIPSCGYDYYIPDTRERESELFMEYIVS